MSTCPDCHGSGADAAKTAAARKRGDCDRLSYIRCWSCNGNGNDTAQDFIDCKRAAEKRILAARAEPDYVPEFPPSRLIDDSPAACAAAYAHFKTRGMP